MSAIKAGPLAMVDLDAVATAVETVVVTGTAVAHGTVIVPLELVRDPSLSVTTKGVWLALAGQPEGRVMSITKHSPQNKRERVQCLLTLFEHGYASVSVDNGGRVVRIHLYDGTMYHQTRQFLSRATKDAEMVARNVRLPAIKPPWRPEEHKPVNVREKVWTDWVAMRRANHYSVAKDEIIPMAGKLEAVPTDEAEAVLNYCTERCYQALHRPRKMAVASMSAERDAVRAMAKT